MCLPSPSYGSRCSTSLLVQGDPTISTFCSRAPRHPSLATSGPCARSARKLAAQAEADVGPQPLVTTLESLPSQGRPGQQRLLPSKALLLGSPRSFLGLPRAREGSDPSPPFPAGKPSPTPHLLQPHLRLLTHGCALHPNMAFGQSQPGTLRRTNS